VSTAATDSAARRSVKYKGILPFTMRPPHHRRAAHQRGDSALLGTTSGDDCRNIVVADEDKDIAILYLADQGRSTLEVEAQLPYDVPILREPFTADELRAAVRPLLPA
jgi:hypothetical protein